MLLHGEERVYYYKQQCYNGNMQIYGGWNKVRCLLESFALRILLKIQMFRIRFNGMYFNESCMSVYRKQMLRDGFGFSVY